MMKTWLLFFLTLFPVTSLQPLDHKFYLSVTQMEFDADRNRITAISRVFVDDLEETLRQRYDVQLALGTDREDAMASFYISRYVEQKLIVEMNNEPLKFSFAGFTYQNDQIVLLSEFSIIHRLPAPMVVGPFKMACGPTTVPAPIVTSGPMMANGPTSTSSASSAVGSTSACGWIVVKLSCPRT